MTLNVALERKRWQRNITLLGHPLFPKQNLPSTELFISGRTWAVIRWSWNRLVLQHTPVPSSASENLIKWSTKLCLWQILRLHSSFVSQSKIQHYRRHHLHQKHHPVIVPVRGIPNKPWNSCLPTSSSVNHLWRSYNNEFVITTALIGTNVTITCNIYIKYSTHNWLRIVTSILCLVPELHQPN